MASNSLEVHQELGAWAGVLRGRSAFALFSSPKESATISISLNDSCRKFLDSHITDRERGRGQADQKQLQVQVKKVDKEQQSVHDCSFQIF